MRQDLLQTPIEPVRDRIGIVAIGRQVRVPRPGEIGCQHLIARLHEVFNIANPVGPAPRSPMQQHKRPALTPHMPHQLARAARCHPSRARRRNACDLGSSPVRIAGIRRRSHRSAPQLFRRLLAWRAASPWGTAPRYRR